jgi:hypothetical protein
MNQFDQAVTQYFALTDSTFDERKQFLLTRHSDEVVEKAVKQPISLADAFFIGAVGSAGTHIHIVHEMGLNKVPPIFVESIAEIIRYAKAICDASRFEGQSYAPLAFVFGTVRRMCEAALKNLELFLGLADRFERLITRLRRVDSYSDVTHREHTSTTTLTSALADIILFCGQVIKYMDGKLRGYEANRFRQFFAKIRKRGGRFGFVPTRSGVGQNW